MKLAATLLLAGALTAAGSPAPAPAPAAAVPKNIILLVGDGMGTAQVTALRYTRGAECRVCTMPVVALVTTNALDAAVTDSAAAGSAYATGEKTHYHGVSVDPEGKPRRTVAEAARDSGRSVGLVTTTYFWDATPSVFVAHAKDRYKEAGDIARQMLASGISLLAGGGLDRLGKDGLPTLDDVTKAGITLVPDTAGLASPDPARVARIFTSGENDQDTADAPLPELARNAIERLRHDPDGFFLLVEHEGIDGASHENRSPLLKSVLTSFDQAVGVALDFASKRDDTLVVVVGDHETGGLRITEGRELRRWRSEWSTMEHTGGAVALFAYGPGSASFAGLLDNTDVGRKLLAFESK